MAQRDRTANDQEVAGTSASNDERRMAPRAAVDLQVDCCHKGTFLFAYMTDVSALGLFVRANNPHPPGTRLKISFTPPGERTALPIDGEVMWVNPYRPEADRQLNAGMGIKFVNLNRSTKRRLAAIVGRTLGAR